MGIGKQVYNLYQATAEIKIIYLSACTAHGLRSCKILTNSGINWIINILSITPVAIKFLKEFNPYQSKKIYT